MSAAEPRYLVGIDLGTSNCAVAAVEPAEEDPGEGQQASGAMP